MEQKNIKNEEKTGAGRVSPKMSATVLKDSKKRWDGLHSNDVKVRLDGLLAKRDLVKLEASEVNNLKNVVFGVGVDLKQLVWEVNNLLGFLQRCENAGQRGAAIEVIREVKKALTEILGIMEKEDEKALGFVKFGLTMTGLRNDEGKKIADSVVKVLMRISRLETTFGLEFKSKETAEEANKLKIAIAKVTLDAWNSDSGLWY